MTRPPITLTATEVEALHVLPPGEPFWLVRDGQTMFIARYGVERDLPPLEFVEATRPCDVCDNTRLVIYRNGDQSETYLGPTPCPECRIELVGPCPMCDGHGMIAHCGRTDNGSDGPCVLSPHDDSFPCYGEGDVASDWSPVSWCTCGVCSCGSRQAWTEQGPCGYCREQPTPGTVTLGCAYAVGEPLAIVQEDDFSPEWQMSHRPIVVISDPRRPASFRFPKIVAWPDPLTEPTGIVLDGNLAHYGPPATLVGKWAQRFTVVPSC